MAARVSNRSLGGGGDGLRLPPHSIEAEQSVLGGLMLDGIKLPIASLARISIATITG